MGVSVRCAAKLRAAGGEGDSCRGNVRRHADEDSACAVTNVHVSCHVSECIRQHPIALPVATLGSTVLLVNTA